MKAASGTVASAAGRVVMALAAGIILAAGLALMWWAITPSTDVSMGDAIQGGVAVWASAHFLPLTIAGAELTIRPLMLTLIVLALVGGAAGRAAPATGARLELVHGALIAGGYGAGVLIFTAVAAPDGLVGLTWYAPFVIAAIGSGAALLVRDSAVRRACAERLPEAVWTGLRAAVAALGGLILGGALIVVTAMVVHFPGTMAIADATAADAAGALGLMAIGVAYVPNVIVAAIGYASGAGFTVGDGWYSPLAANAVDLPAIPLLSVVPRTVGGSGYLTLAVPVLAALLATAIVRRGATPMRQRLLAGTIAALVVGAGLALLTASASGGVTGGAWSSSGAPVLLTSGIVAGAVLVVNSVISAVIDGIPRLGQRREARRVAPSDAHEPPGEPRDAAGDVTIDDGPRVPADVDEAAETDEAAGADEAPETDEAAGTDEPPDADEAAGTDEVTGTDEATAANDAAPSPTEESSAA